MLGARYAFGEFTELGVAGVTQTSSLVGISNETLHEEIFFQDQGVSGRIDTEFSLSSYLTSDDPLLKVGAFAFELDRDFGWFEPEVSKHIRLVLMSGPPVPYLQWQGGDGWSNYVPLKATHAMECPEDYDEKVIYATSTPKVCFDTSKIDPIRSSYIPEGEYSSVSLFNKTNWFFIIEQCHDDPECADPAEIASFLEDKVIWTGEYTRFVNSANSHAMKNFVDGKHASPYLGRIPTAQGQYTLESGVTKSLSFLIRKQTVETDYGWLLGGVQVIKDSHY